MYLGTFHRWLLISVTPFTSLESWTLTERNKDLGGHREFLWHSLQCSSVLWHLSLIFSFFLLQLISCWIKSCGSCLRRKRQKKFFFFFFGWKTNRQGSQGAPGVSPCVKIRLSGACSGCTHTGCLILQHIHTGDIYNGFNIKVLYSFFNANGPT